MSNDETLLVKTLLAWGLNVTLFLKDKQLSISIITLGGELLARLGPCDLIHASPRYPLLTIEKGVKSDRSQPYPLRDMYSPVNE